ncbi:MAG: hypothetical protein KC492_05865, partial [Myxococcales bacterium]|nr:hypothetical protein [Myxococcales bacterium]
ESVLPALAGLVLAVSVFVGTLVYLTRRGPAEIRGRAARVARWAAPVAVGIALVRLVTLAVGY